MNQKPFASIIVPTFNQAKYLPEALDSLLAQTDDDWEAIVINDGSTDQTREIMESYERRDSRIRCFHQENGGVAEALNTGLRNARGVWIHWLSSDDLFEPDKLAVNRKWIQRHPETKFFFSYFTLLRENTGEREQRDLWGPLPTPELQILTLFYRNFISGISICVNRSAWSEVGFFDTELFYAQDYDQWLRLLQRYKARFIPEWTVVSRNHAEQGSETFPDACYFDTAKAAIRFINGHSFPELVPWANLQCLEEATVAVKGALDVACEKSSFVYSLGAHPALILRILEWVFAQKSRYPSIMEIVGARICEMSFHDGDDDWSWMWRQLAMALHVDRSQFSYQSIDPNSLAQSQWRAFATDGDQKQTAMREYLTRFENIKEAEFSAKKFDRSRVVFFVQSRIAKLDIIIEAANQLQQDGLRPIILVENAGDENTGFQWRDSIAIVHANEFNKNSLPWLGEVELFVSEAPMSKIWLSSPTQLTINEQENAAPKTIANLVVSSLCHDKNCRPIVFLERSLWGGGAERVFYDLVRYLDKKRFAPIVITMFEEHVDGPTWPSHVVFKKIGNATQLNDKSKAHHDHQSISMSNITRFFISILSKAYHKLVDLRWRSKLKIGPRLVATTSRIKLFLRSVLGWRPKLAITKNTIISVVKNRSQALSKQSHNCEQEDITQVDGDRSNSKEFDLVAAMIHHNPLAVELAKEVSELGENAVVVSAMEEAAVVSTLAKAATQFPHIATLHSLESKCLQDMYPDPVRLRAEKRLLTLACRDAEVVTLPSQGCCTDLNKHFNIKSSKIRRIWNPIDCARIAHLSNQKIESAERWQRENTVFRLVFVGRLDPQKNPLLLLEACSILKQRGREFSLAIVGDGWYKADVERRIDELELEKYVFLAGSQVNPFPWIVASDSLVLTSRFEAFALVLAEALACGTPVVSVDCPTGPAEVLSDGSFGILTEQSAAAVADGIERLMIDDELRKSLSQKGFSRAEMFDIKNIIREWEALFQEAQISANN